MADGKKLSELDASVGDVPDAFYGISGDRSLRYSARQIADYGRPIASREEAIEGISDELAMTPYLTREFVVSYVDELPPGPEGPQGPQGIPGEDGEPGADGAQGVGIDSVSGDNTGSLVITLDDGQVFTTPPLSGDAGAAAQAAGYRDEAEAAAAQAQASADELSDAVEVVVTLEDGTLLVDGTRRVMGLRSYDDTYLGDMMRLKPDGLLMEESQENLDKGLSDGRVVLGPLKMNGARDLLQIGGAGALFEVYPDGGMNFKPSDALKQQLGGTVGGDVPQDGWAPITDDDGVTSFMGMASTIGPNAVDRFTLRQSDGTRFPVPVVNGVQRECDIISLNGQSNADVTAGGDPLFWGRPPMPYHAFMLNDRNNPLAVIPRGYIVGWQGGGKIPDSSNFPSAIINAQESLQRANSYGSAAFATLNLLRGGTYHAGVIRSSAFGGQAFIGSVPGQGIWKDSNGDYSTSWVYWQYDIDQIISYTRAAGYLVNKLKICFTHQEANWQTPRATYLQQANDFKADAEATIIARHPDITIEWFVDQASGSGLRTGNYRGGAWPDRMAITDFAKAHANVTMVMPRYILPFGLTAETLEKEDIHHSNRAKIWQGELYGHAMRARELGLAWQLPELATATVSGNSVIANFTSQYPIRIDPTICKVRTGDMGFGYWDGTTYTPATNVRITGPRQITMDFPVTPSAGQYLRYAYRSFDAIDQAEGLTEWPLATGAVCDQWSYPSMFDSTKEPVRPALGNEIQIGA